MIEETDIRITYIDPPDPPARFSLSIWAHLAAVLAAALGGYFSAGIFLKDEPGDFFKLEPLFRTVGPFAGALVGAITSALCQVILRARSAHGLSWVAPFVALPAAFLLSPVLLMGGLMLLLMLVETLA